MKGKNVLVTGATAGIGFYTAKALASKGAQVMVTGRNEQRGKEAIEEIRRHAKHGQIDFIAADHSTVGGNLDLVNKISRRWGHLDVLINNAGGMYSQRKKTEDGYEYTLAMNFIGPFTLTEGLLPLLRKNTPTRIINVVSSASEMWKRRPFEDLESKENYVGIQVYGHAKLLNMLWTFALARKLNGSDITVNAVNPGMAWTPNTRAITPEAVPAWKMIWPIVRWMQRRASAEKASKSAVFLASSENLQGVSGKYFESRTKPKRPPTLATDAGNQERVLDFAKMFVENARTG